MKDEKVRLKRMRDANMLIKVISIYGRQFFRHKHRVSFFEVRRQRLWFVDKWTQRGVYVHDTGPWRGFTEGHTLHELVRRLKDFVFFGSILPDFVLGGDPWGYGSDMEHVRKAARDLGITE